MPRFLLRGVCALAVIGFLGSPAYASPNSPAGTQQRRPVKIETIALDATGGVVSESIGIKLSSLGFNIVDPRRFTTGGSAGVDAVLTVHEAHGYYGQITTVTARVTDVATGSLLAGVVFENPRIRMER